MVLLATPPRSSLGMSTRGRWEAAALLLPVSLRRQKEQLCLSWVGICGSGDRGGLCEKPGWHQRQGELLHLYILVLDSVHRHMHGATHSHQSSLLAYGFTKPSPRSRGFRQLSATSPHSADATFFSPPFPLQPQRALFSMKCISPLPGTSHRELWRGAEEKSLQ